MQVRVYRDAGIMGVMFFYAFVSGVPFRGARS